MVCAYFICCCSFEDITPINFDRQPVVLAYMNLMDTSVRALVYFPINADGEAGIKNNSIDALVISLTEIETSQSIFLNQDLTTSVYNGEINQFVLDPTFNYRLTIKLPDGEILNALTKLPEFKPSIDTILVNGKLFDPSRIIYDTLSRLEAIYDPKDGFQRLHSSILLIDDQDTTTERSDYLDPLTHPFIFPRGNKLAYETNIFFNSRNTNNFIALDIVACDSNMSNYYGSIDQSLLIGWKNSGSPFGTFTGVPADTYSNIEGKGLGVFGVVDIKRYWLPFEPN
jgi:hypothetical protein